MRNIGNRSCCLRLLVLLQTIFLALVAIELFGAGLCLG
jgi:hypothetical protein